MAGSDLVIIDSYPAENANIASQMTLPDTPVELFFTGDKLVVFVTGHEEIFYRSDLHTFPVPSWRPVTKALIYDVTDRSDPDLERTITITGS